MTTVIIHGMTVGVCKCTCSGGRGSSKISSQAQASRDKLPAGWLHRGHWAERAQRGVTRGEGSRNSVPRPTPRPASRPPPPRGDEEEDAEDDARQQLAAAAAAVLLLRVVKGGQPFYKICISAALKDEHPQVAEPVVPTQWRPCNSYQGRM